jgi:hypothetical protein
MTFNNKEYLNNCLKDMRERHFKIIQLALKYNQPLDSPIIVDYEKRILAFAKQIKKS